jgi:hypothetical protein
MNAVRRKGRVLNKTYPAVSEACGQPKQNREHFFGPSDAMCDGCRQHPCCHKGLQASQRTKCSISEPELARILIPELENAWRD